MCKKFFYLSYFVLMLGLVLTNAAKAQDPNLVGWWKFDESTADSSGNGNNGIAYGGPQWFAGQVGGALDFDGLDDYVDLPIGSLINSLTNSTFAIWANFSGTGGAWQRLWDFGTGTNVYMFLSPRTGGAGPMRFVITTNSNAPGAESIIDAPSTLASGWHHVAVVINGASRNMQLLLDGDVIASGLTQTLPADLGLTNQNWLGRSQWSGDAYYSGSLDDFRIYNRALTVDEVERLGPPKLSARRPSPADGAMVTTTAVTLIWAAGQTTDSHHVYFGENIDDVRNGTGGTDKGLTKATTYTPANLATGKTYYWRIDEVEADGTTVHTGPVWSFTISQMIASNPAPPNGTIFIDPNVSLTWAVGSGAISHHVYFGDSYQDVQAGTGGTDKGTVEAAAFVPGTLESGKTYYWRVDEFDGTAIYTGDLWSFTTMPVIPITNPNLVGWWKFDEGVGTILVDWSGHNYNGVLIGGPQWVEGYDGGALKLDGVDDYVALSIGSLMPTLHEATLAIWVNWSGQGGAWQRFIDFGTGQANYIYICPFTGVNSSLHVAIVAGNALWNEFFSSKGALPTGWHHVAVTLSESYSTIIMYLDGENVGSITNVLNTLNDLGETTNNWLGRSQYADPYFNGSLDDFRIYNYVQTQEEILKTMRGGPLLAWNQKPVNRAVTDIEKALPLSWSPGENAAQHDVYFGTDASVVGSADTSDKTGIYQGRQDPNSFSPPEGVKAGQTYYWRIDEVNTDGTISKSSVWSFTTAEYLIVDDFEGYNDVDNKIYDAWEDYFVNGTGMTVGHFNPPFAEQSIVHGSRQAMFMRYDNDGTVNEGTSFEKTGTKFYSEAERQWADAQDLTRKGITSLTLWFRGMPGSIGSFSLGPPIKMTAIGTDIAGTADQCHFAYKKLSGNGVVTAKVLSITNTNSLAKAGVMMRESLDAGSKNFTTVASPGNRVSFVRRTTTGGAAVSTPRAGVTLPVWVRLTRNGNTFTAQYSTNGNTWMAVGTPQEVQMPVEVYVGLCLTSSNVNAICTAEFSDVTNPGTGDWKSQDIGLAVNAPEQLYVALQDSAGQSAVVKHSNPAATTITTYTEWNIPLTEFTGVNLQSIKKLSIGVGDRDNPQRGGAGDLYIDDIVLRLP
ncbi:MAG: hypothetical protein MUO97_11485 [Dehalococcoidia bacterium]|nr:hypothetical protein [Dehalococcoidia bacterium]